MEKLSGGIRVFSYADMGSKQCHKASTIVSLDEMQKSLSSDWTQFPLLHVGYPFSATSWRNRLASSYDIVEPKAYLALLVVCESR